MSFSATDAGSAAAFQFDTVAPAAMPFASRRRASNPAPEYVLVMTATATEHAPRFLKERLASQRLNEKNARGRW
jgi:hypothetical protein